MIRPILHLTADELARLVGAIDPLAVLVDEFTGNGADGRLTPWAGPEFGGPVPAGDLVLLVDSAGRRCVLPSSALSGLRTASMVALAARDLVAPGVLTAAVLGFGPVTWASLTLVERNLTGFSHAALCTTGGSVPRAVTEPLERAGIGWSTPSSVSEAVFGATLVVATVVTARWDGVVRLPGSATVINTTGLDLPDRLVDAVDQVFVDDLDLIGRNPHRHFARMHMIGSGEAPRPPGRPGEHRRHRRVRADFAELLAGGRAGRSHADEVLLVELLGTDKLDVGLASSLHRAALAHGLGVKVIG